MEVEEAKEVCASMSTSLRQLPRGRAGCLSVFAIVVSTKYLSSLPEAVQEETYMSHGSFIVSQPGYLTFQHEEDGLGSRGLLVSRQVCNSAAQKCGVRHVLSPVADLQNVVHSLTFPIPNVFI